MHVQKSFDPASDAPTGKLYIVATPIGNLEDITYRAVRILQEVDMIAAEDTRHTRKLLTHFSIQARLVSYHKFNHIDSGKELVRFMKQGSQVALVSDAGLPAVSDPGYELVLAALQAEIPVIPIPGANAALTALVASGLPSEHFYFAGFLPKNKKEAQTMLDQLRRIQATVIFYESPHRLLTTLQSLRAHWGDRQMVIARELTKRFEEFIRGSIEQCIAWVEAHPPQGEFCLVVEGISDSERLDEETSWWQAMDITGHVSHYEQLGHTRKEAMKQTAVDRGIPKREVYQSLLTGQKE